ncbi:MAG TPA: thiamine biosynthesis protein ThiS, partial [Candidatus Nitrosopelagicus sp.]|nr:thiamine biosynthesis protein ThiS [Candidatus Nitrosopelagicus sp.]
GKKTSLNKLHTELKPDINSKLLSRNNVSYIQKQFGISKKQISVISSKNPLEDILVERAAILF